MGNRRRILHDDAQPSHLVMYFLARAYSVAPASDVAPFEYVALPISIMWGLLLWQEVPTWLTLAGASLTLGSGLYILYQQRQERPVAA